MPSFPLRPVVALILSAFGAGAIAQVPDAGSLLQQARPPSQPAPASGETGLKIEREGKADVPASMPFDVKSIRISGSTVFDEHVLHDLVKDAEGRRLTLAEVHALAERITAWYRSHGHALTRAVVPAQVVRDGVIELRVVEARYGGVELKNSSAVADSLARETLAALTPGNMIEQRPLERSLLLLSDLPGTNVSGTLKPGAEVGTSDLNVDLTGGPPVAGSVRLDNEGNAYTGRVRLGASMNVYNPLHHGDVLSVGGVTAGERMAYARLAYEGVLNGQGTRAGAALSALHYRLGGALEPLGAKGDAEVASLWLAHPLVRSREFNLHAQLQWDRQELRDRVSVSDVANDRHVDQGTLAVSGDITDILFGQAITSFSAAVTSGRLNFDDAKAQLADAATAGTQGSFSKWNLNLNRLQRLMDRLSLYLAFSGQWAAKNLDSSEKMVVGGPSGVRAYDTGALSADVGRQLSVELRQAFSPVLGGSLQALVFVDTAKVTPNRHPWIDDISTTTLSGAGVGLRWTGAGRWSVDASVATPTGSEPGVPSVVRKTRGWVQVGWAF